MNSPGRTIRSPAEAMTRIRETPGYLYLETGINNLYVPKRAFGPDQLVDVRADPALIPEKKVP